MYASLSALEVPKGKHQ